MPDKPIHRLDINDPDVEEKLKQIHAQMLAASPKQIRKLGKILRSRSVLRLRWFLARHGHAGEIDPKDLPLFMDYLITQRIDLKDMEPDARRRLREHSLKKQPVNERTKDYIECIEHGCTRLPHGETRWSCKLCAWFIVAPPGDDKSCVEMGTKGIDEPCYGFTIKNQV